MIQKEKNRTSLLFLMAFVPCLSFSQTSNNGVLSLKAGTVLSSVYPVDNNAGAQIINDGELLFYDDFKNNGTTGFTSGASTGKTRFLGIKTSLLAISGSGKHDVYNIEFNSNSDYQVSSGINVAGTADFQNGIINYSGDGLLSFGNNAVTLNASDASHVMGAVVKKGNKEFVFPVGDGGKFRPASISAPSELDASFTGEYVFDNPNSLYSLSSKEASVGLIDEAEYWTIKRTDSGLSNVFVTLKWDDATTPAALLTEPIDELHVVRWDDVNKLWIDEGGTVDWSRKEVVTVSESLGSYGVFTLARILPISGKVVIVDHPGISPNGDGVNDELEVIGLESYPDNKVTVFDRFGKVVFETTGYNTKGNVFKGFFHGDSGKILPIGTYFYTVDYLDTATGRRVRKTNYLYINLR